MFQTILAVSPTRKVVVADCYNPITYKGVTYTGHSPTLQALPVSAYNRHIAIWKQCLFSN